MSKGFMATPKKRLIAIIGFTLVAMSAGGVVGYIQASREFSGMVVEGFFWWALVIGALLAAVSYWFGAVWMKSIDEAAQEAHKWSWYWGGSAGLAVAMAAYFVSFLPEARNWDVPTLSGRSDPISYVVTGGLGVVLLLLIGYTVAWAFWWFQRR